MTGRTTSTISLVLVQLVMPMAHHRRALDTKVRGQGNSRAWHTDGQIDVGTAGRGPGPASDWAERPASAWPESPVTLRQGMVEGERREIKSWAGGQGEQQCSRGRGEKKGFFFCGLWLWTARPSVCVNKWRVRHTCGLVLEPESEEDKQQNISNSGNSCTSSLGPWFYNHCIGFSRTQKINRRLTTALIKNLFP